MALSAFDTYANGGIVPAYANIPSPQLPVKLLPSLTLAKGTWLEELPGGAAVGPLTIGSASATTGAITASETAQTVFNSAGTLVLGRTAIISAGLADEETVTLLVINSGTTFTAVFRKNHAASASLTMPATTGTGVYQAFASGLCRSILKYAVASDVSGNITLGTASTGGPSGEKSLDTPAYFGGAFRSEETVGGTATGLGATGLNGHLMHGTLVTGVFAF